MMRLKGLVLHFLEDGQTLTRTQIANRCRGYKSKATIDRGLDRALWSLVADRAIVETEVLDILGDPTRGYRLS